MDPDTNQPLCWTSCIYKYSILCLVPQTSFQQPASLLLSTVDLPMDFIRIIPSALLFCLFAFLISYFQPSVLRSRTNILPVVEPELELADHLQTYIVHVQKPGGAELLGAQELESWHVSFLPSTTLDSGDPRLIHSYSHVISGFAARLTPKEVRAMESIDGFLYAHPARRFKPHTTHSPSFLGLHQGNGFWADTKYGEGMVIGVLDSGVVPTHPSFKDDGMPEPPPEWKGRCGFDPSFCNKKIVKAVGFNKGKSVSPIDDSDDGHGTNTASIAAGNFVENADVLGSAKGTASGIAPRAFLAIYKVCFEDDCLEADILAGMNEAIKDKVDVLSISIGSEAEPFYKDSIAVGSFRAIDKGFFVSCSAGNDGPSKSTVENDAPWILTVGASTIDRIIRATVKLGNGGELHGESAYQPSDFPSTLLPLVYPGAKGDRDAKACKASSLVKFDVKGKIVMCLAEEGGGGEISKGKNVKNAGGAGMILMNQKPEQFTTFAMPHVLPASHVTYSDSLKIQEYASSSNPTATIIFKGTLFGALPSPTVAAFSGRGPSKQNGGILKPDIIGPGVNIVAATPFQVGPHPSSSSAAKFDMVYGTSIATPHLAGVGALLKKSHPDWSAAAIKSAIMTASDALNRDGKPITDETSNPASYFAKGAGHVNPAKANDPGLVYNIQPEDYIPYLCGLKYSDKQVSAVTNRKIKCSDFKEISADQLNCPSFALSVPRGSTKKVTRTVTNVGEAKSVYVVKVDAPRGVKVTTTPTLIKFSKLNQKESFDVQFSADKSASKGSVSEGQLRLEYKQKYVVRSPISITFT